VYHASVAVHVVAAIVGFGSTFSYPVIQIVGERRGARDLAMTTILAISRWVAVPATLVVGATGVYQLVDGPYGLDEAWLTTGLALYVAVMGVATGYLAPAYARAGRAVTVGEYRRAVRGINVVGPLVAAAVVAVAVLMVVKPG
jgi:uncharacterized membrane protein